MSSMIINPYSVSPGYTPASFVFNGTDENLTRTLSTSAPNTSTYTYSLWVKVAAYSGVGNAALFMASNTPVSTFQTYSVIDTNGDVVDHEQNQPSGGDDFSEVSQSLTPDITTGSWVHLVFRVNTTEGSGANRVRSYRNGVLLATNGGASISPVLNAPTQLFTNGFVHNIGTLQPRFTDMLDGKIAFVDVVEGLSLDPTDFAFDNGGTWTRLRYTGSYGTHGFKLDGSNGFNDVSGNGQNFTGTNMTTGANLDLADLPPYTN